MSLAGATSVVPRLAGVGRVHRHKMVLGAFFPAHAGRDPGRRAPLPRHRAPRPQPIVPKIGAAPAPLRPQRGVPPRGPALHRRRPPVAAGCCMLRRAEGYVSVPVPPHERCGWPAPPRSRARPASGRGVDLPSGFHEQCLQFPCQVEAGPLFRHLRPCRRRAAPQRAP